MFDITHTLLSFLHFLCEALNAFADSNRDSSIEFHRNLINNFSFHLHHFNTKVIFDSNLIFFNMVNFHIEIPKIKIWFSNELIYFLKVRLYFILDKIDWYQILLAQDTLLWA